MTSIKKRRPHYYPEGLRDAVAKRDNRTCRLCGKPKLYKRALTLDHVIPVSQGGETKEDNLVVLCKLCNSRKGKKPLVGYIEHRIEEVERELNILKEAQTFLAPTK